MRDIQSRIKIVSSKQSKLIRKNYNSGGGNREGGEHPFQYYNNIAII